MTAKHIFLSEEWLVAVRELRDRHQDEAPKPELPVRVNQTVTDHPFEELEDHLLLHIDTTSGTVVLERGHLEIADVSVTTDYATARSILVEQDMQAAMQAFMAGKIKVQGDMTRLLGIQQQPSHPVSRQIAEGIKDLTE